MKNFSVFGVHWKIKLLRAERSSEKTDRGGALPKKGFENFYQIQYNSWKVMRKLAILDRDSKIQETMEVTSILYKFLIITSNSSSTR